MEYAAIRALMDKYWEAETTLEEESELVAYFRKPDIDPRLRPFREMFVYFEQESRVKPGEGFEKRILEAVRRADPATAPVRRMWRGVNSSYAAAAAVILVIGLFIMVPSSRRAAGLSVYTITVAGVGDAAWVVKAPVADPRSGNSLFVLSGKNEVVVGAPPQAPVRLLAALVRKIL